MQNRTMKDGYPLRFPDGLREQIKEQAEKNCRSMNAEIVYHLQRALAQEHFPESRETKKAEARA